MKKEPFLLNKFLINNGHNFSKYKKTLINNINKVMKNIAANMILMNDSWKYCLKIVNH